MNSAGLQTQNPAGFKERDEGWRAEAKAVWLLLSVLFLPSQQPKPSGVTEPPLQSAICAGTGTGKQNTYFSFIWAQNSERWSPELACRTKWLWKRQQKFIPVSDFKLLSSADQDGIPFQNMPSCCFGTMSSQLHLDGKLSK